MINDLLIDLFPKDAVHQQSEQNSDKYIVSKDTVHQEFEKIEGQTCFFFFQAILYVFGKKIERQV